MLRVKTVLPVDFFNDVVSRAMEEKIMVHPVWAVGDPSGQYIPHHRLICDPHSLACTMGFHAFMGIKAFFLCRDFRVVGALGGESKGEEVKSYLIFRLNSYKNQFLCNW